jgi:hypothetical protein
MLDEHPPRLAWLPFVIRTACSPKRLKVAPLLFDIHADASSEKALLVQASMSWASSLSEPHLPIVDALEHNVDDASTGVSRVPS